MRRPILALLLMAAPVAPAAAQQIVTSDRTDAVSVTLYRDPQRGEGAIDGDWPRGYALITETRTISIPAGRAVIRFEGVSQGMLPETAIVTGLPKGVAEKNRDALLLSPAGLVDAYLKRRVTVRRTDRATGKVRELPAVIESGPGGGVLLTTAEGVQAMGCSGLPEAMVYPGVPEGLSARPTLSVVADAQAATTVTVRLSYLAEGFDWSAAYVARLADDGKTLDLFAWLTVANGGSQGFADASTQAVAGMLNKEKAAKQPKSPDPTLRLKCWPMDTTSTHPRWGGRVPPPPPPPPAPMMEYADEITVTAERRRELKSANFGVVLQAKQEDLGDLKLYRIPESVTVAAKSRKQVAMIDRKQVAVERVYGGQFETFELDDYREVNQPSPQSAYVVLRTENREARGLGLPLPAGGVSVFEAVDGQSMLVGESKLADRAIGEEVEFGVGASPDILYRVIARPRSGRRQPYEVRVTNARATPEVFELTIPYDVAKASETLGKRKGQTVWRTVVPANGSAKLEFSLKLAAEG